MEDKKKQQETKDKSAADAKAQQEIADKQKQAADKLK